MNIKRIEVDELPEDGCCECRFSKVYTSRFGNDKVRCVVTNKSVSDFAFGYTKQPRPSWCPLVVEEVCEWVREKTDRGYAAFYIPKDHEQHLDCYTQDDGTFTFCPLCGRRIVYKERRSRMRRKRNLEHLANCPFCGNHELELEDSTGDITCNACAYTFYDTSVDSAWWNSRPIEDQLRAENERLMEEIKQSNSLLRSAFMIAKRDGKETNWEAFRGQLDIALERQHKMMYRDAEQALKGGE